MSDQDKKSGDAPPSAEKAPVPDSPPRRTASAKIINCYYCGPVKRHSPSCPNNETESSSWSEVKT